MSAPKETIAALGAGRMGRGIAIVFAYAGHRVEVIDFKHRDATGFAALKAEADAEIRETLELLAQLGLFAGEGVIDTLCQRICLVSMAQAGEALGRADVVFEGVPEVLDLKREALREASRLCRAETIIASTTSTILVDDLSPAVEHPERFLNAHWLNPAFLMPLVEVSPGAQTSVTTRERLVALLERVGKVPVLCAAKPGFIVPRLQTVAMNEAARMVEQGVASAEDIDKAVRYGFGLRFSVLGLLEFIDWGGGDILYYGSRYLAGALGDSRYEAPPVIERNMTEGRIGLKAKEGFLNYRELDIPSYRKARLGGFVRRLQELDLVRAPDLGASG